jgi:type II secretion system protein J
MKGFTLLEILVSMALLSIVLASVYAAYESNAFTIQKTRYESELWQTARIVLDRMAKDMESAFLDIQEGMVSENKQINGRAADNARFITLAHLSLHEIDPQTDICRVEYYLSEDSKNNCLALYRKEEMIIADGVVSGANIYEIANMVTGLEIDFEDNNGTQSSEWGFKDGLPTLIRIGLRLQDRLGHEYNFMTSVHPGITYVWR